MRCFNLRSLRIPVSLVLVPLMSLMLATSAFPLSPVSAPAVSTEVAGQVTGITPGNVLAFTKTADPTTVRPGDVVTYTLQLIARADLADVTVTDLLPDGVTYVPGSANAGQYDPSTHQITWDLPALAADATATLTFQARVTGEATGEVLNRATVTAAGYDGSLETVAGVRVLPPPAEAVITPAQGGVLSAADGRVVVAFPPGAVDRAVVARYVPQVRADGGFLLTFDLEAHAQTDDRPVARFAQPVTVTVRYTAEDGAWLRAHSAAVPMSPALWFFDPSQEEWIRVPGILDREARTFIAQLTHFSTYGYGDPTDFEPGIQPTVKGFQVSQFTGDATDSLPLYTPPGPGGLLPELVLRYNSGAVADLWLAERMSQKLSATSQPGWVGQGWSLDFGTITRDFDGKHPALTDQHRFVLSMGGVAGRLVEDGQGYYRLERDPSWRIRWDGGPDHGTWIVWAPDGTQYTFGERMEYLVWRESSATCGYSSEAKTYRWYLTQIQDTSGNQVTFTYEKVTEVATYGETCDGANYHSAVYPSEIQYGPQNQIVISFQRDGRSDYDPSWESGTGGQERYQREKLDRIDVTVNGQLVRRYLLEYYPTGWPPEGGNPAGTQWLTLQRIRTIGWDESSEWPTTVFSYTSAYTGNTGVQTVRAVLSQVDNGYDGRLTFGYDYFYAGWCYSDPCGYVYRYRVQQRQLDDGLGGMQRYDYSFTGETGNQSRHEFWGHRVVTETVYADAWTTPIAKTETTFHQSDDGTWDPPVRLGQPKKVRWLDGSGNELRRTEQAWGWAEVYPGVYSVSLVETNTYDGAARRRTAYLTDDYGNTVAELAYGGFGDGTQASNGGYGFARYGFSRYGGCEGQTIDVGNPGFEGVNDPSWDLSPWVAYWGANVNNSEEGRRVGKLVMTGSNTGGAYQDVAGLTPGETYEVLAWVRATAGATAKFNLWLHDTQGGNSVQGPVVTPGPAWELVRLTYKANSTGQVRIHLHYTAGSGTIYVDNVSLGSVDDCGDERTVHRRFNPNTDDPDKWIVDRVARESVYWGIHPGDDDDTSRLVARTRYHYDLDQYNNPQPWTNEPTEGLVTQVDRWNGGLTGGDSDFSITGYRYDGFGNREQVIDPLGNTTVTTYDDGFRAFPVCVKNARGQRTKTKYYGVPGSSNANCPTDAGSSVTGDGPFFGAVESVTDPNGAATEVRYRYDVFGRLTKEIRPGDSDTVPTVKVTYNDYCSTPGCSLSAPTKVQVSYQEQSGDANAFRPMLYFYDGLGRVVQTKAESQNGTEMIVTNVTYDARGLKEKEYVPYFVNDSGSFWNYVTPDTNQPRTSYTYDALGREEQRTNPDNTMVRTDYDGWQTTVLDEKNHQTIYERDAYGRLVKVKEYTGTGPYTLYATTGYSYNGLDQLTGVTDAAGNATTIAYDPLGRKTSMDDPDMGAWGYAYDAAGNLTRQTDARGQTLCFFYDELNRLKGKTYRTDTNCPADPGYSGYTIKYYYDQTGHGSGVGRRTQMVDNSGTTDWTYDNRGRMTEETKVINGTGGGTFKTQWSYDAMDRVVTMTYPGGNAGQLGEPVTFSHNAAALVDSVAGDSTYVQSSTYDALNRVTQRTLGSGSVQTARVYYPWTTANGRGRLQQIKAGTSSNPTSLQDLRYQYDAVGNVTYMEWNAGVWEGMYFDYDDLNRLTMAGGESYGYSGNEGKIGNLTYKSDIGYYSYSSSKPHAVISAGGNSYGYDANGNMASRTIGGTSYTLSYDAENRLTQVSGGASASFVYDGDGRRVKATFGTTTTVYIGDYYEMTGSTVHKYYYAGGERVAMREAGTLYWLLADHLGSTAITAYSGGGKKAELRYKAWGETRYSDGTTPTTYRFTGQREDATIGLYFYGARYYDAVLGRFVQADTIVPAPANPQDLNRYSYVRNNPLRYVDPSGRAICEDEDCTRVVHPVSGKLVRRQPPQIDWASIPSVVRFVYKGMLASARGGTVAQLRAWNTQCLSCGAPAHPEVQYTAAIADAEARVLAAGLFAWKVRQGGEWDPKPLLQREFGKEEESTYWNQLREGGPEYYYDVWGNVGYGYLGTAAAFSEGALLEGAGVEQIGSSLGYTVKEFDLKFLPKRMPGIEGLRAWDDPADQTGTQLGIDLWNTYNLTLTPMDIIQAVERTPGLTTR